MGKYKIAKSRMVSRGMLFTLPLAFAFSMFPSTAFADSIVNVSNYTDISEHWAMPEILKWTGNGILNGYEDNSFRPNDYVSRGEMAVIIDKIMNYKTISENTFADLSGEFYANAILRAKASGVISNTSNMIHGNENLTRQETVVMLAKAMGLNVEEQTSFSDDDKIAVWAKGYVAAMKSKGYISGYEGNLFQPEGFVKRGEVVKILDNMISALYNEKGVYTINAPEDVVVSAPDVTLNGSVIEGNLIISEGVSDGEITLENVTVKGNTYIHGGGIHTVKVVDSSLNGVTIDNKLSNVRILTEGNTTIDNVSVVTGTILEGSFNNVELNSNATTTIKGDLKSLIVTGAAKVKAEKGQMNSISISASSIGSDITLGKDVTVDNMDINGVTMVNANGNIKTVNINATAEKTELKGTGMISNVNVNANNVTLNLVTKGTNVTVANGLHSVNIDGRSATGGTINTSSSRGSSSGGSSSSQVRDIYIKSVESVENGHVRVELSQKTSVPLTLEAFDIICTGGGNDMTILNVRTTDNKVYDITTAFYKDNTYNIEVVLPNNKRINKDFESKYDCPTLSFPSAKRLDGNSANFAFDADSPGKFYYGLVEETKSRSIMSFTGEPTIQELKEKGTQEEMVLHANSIIIPNLVEGTPYTLYYAAEDLDGKTTTLKSILVSGISDVESDTSDITVLNAKATMKENIDSVLDELCWFDFELSEPTEEQLVLSNFTVTCPATGEVSLGRLETTDNKNYRIYMTAGSWLVDNNTFTVKIEFADGIVATKSFYVDFTAPDVILTIKGNSATEHTVTLKADEPGKVYYKIYDNVPQDISVKNPKDIYETGTVTELYYGNNEITISNVEEGKWFVCATEDKYGNKVPNYFYKKIPKYVPDVTPPVDSVQILSATASVDSSKRPRVAVTFDREVNLSSIDNSLTQISKLSGKGMYILEFKNGGFSGTELYVTIGNGLELSEGMHKITLYINEKAISFDFNVVAADNIKNIIDIPIEPEIVVPSEIIPEVSSKPEIPNEEEKTPEQPILPNEKEEVLEQPEIPKEEEKTPEQPILPNEKEEVPEQLETPKTEVIIPEI